MKILVGMSGGVDSTYSALKLMNEGNTVEGCVLVMHEYTDTDAAKRAAEELDIPLHIIDLRSEFSSTVKPYFIGEYLNARTPNPCIVCNPKIKFKYLAEYARRHGFDAIATGHYARVIKTSDGRFTVAIADDIKKDQSYMLSRLPQDILSMLILPLSDVTKDEVRLGSEISNLTAARSRDSQEICFIPDGDYAAYIEAHTASSPVGNFISEDGRVLGTHSGIIRYTVGQRKGLGIALGERAFVTEISPADNTVTLALSPRYDSEVYVSDIAWMGIDEPEVGTELKAFAKLRYAAPLAECKAVYLGEGRARISLLSPARSVTPGQAAVLYKDGAVIFSGFICRK